MKERTSEASDVSPLQKGGWRKETLSY
jgi:hypothetical protein